MNLRYTESFLRALDAAPAAVQKAFFKQARFLSGNLQHPSLRAKKYDESRGIWQARVNRDWRFYFVLQNDEIVIIGIIPHPKSDNESLTQIRVLSLFSACGSLSVGRGRMVGRINASKWDTHPIIFQLAKESFTPSCLFS